LSLRALAVNLAPYAGKLHPESFAERIGGARYGKDTAIYKFEKIKRAKRAAMQAHPETELFDLGVGEPDAMADAGIVEALYAAAKKRRTAATRQRRRAAEAGAAKYLHDVCDVTVNAETQIVHSIGSKAALSILPAALINPGDVALMTVPGYPVFAPTRSITAVSCTTCLCWRRTVSCRPKFNPRRRAGEGEGARPQLSEQPDRRERHVGVLRRGGRVREGEQPRRHPRFRPTRRSSSRASR